MNDQLLDAIIAAGLRHELSWQQVQRLVDQLPAEDDPCSYCGGRLEPQGLPRDRAWRCVSCGRIHCEGSEAHYFEEYEWVLQKAIADRDQNPEPAVDLEREAARDRLKAELAVIKGGAA